MSGGVDSSAAALMMKNEGWECVGATMRLFDPEETEPGCKSCCSFRDALDASSVARRLEIPFHIMDFREEFKKEVIDRFISEYEAGRTPNPCIECNRHLKLGYLWEKARELGCDAIATGHYARIEEEDGRLVLKKALDENKDQSYVLYMIPRDMLGMIKFPLGGMTSKNETRQTAKDAGLANSQKRESQDICFVPDGDYAAVIEKYTGKTYEEGDFVDEEGNVLGRHRGIHHYTTGQRKGLGISALPEPYYVIRKDTEANTVVLGPNDRLFERELEADDVNWIYFAPGEVPESFRCAAKIRYKAKPAPCTVFKKSGSESEIRVLFDEPQRAVTPGQAVVFYDGEIVLGGGTIL